MPVKYMLLALLIFITMAAGVQGEEAQPDPPIPFVYDTDASLPSMELLEFLGEWESDDGEWTDPLLLDEMPLTERESSDD